MNPMDPIIREFLAESLENLEQVERDLMELEKDPGDSKEGIDRVFRAIHTIKGTCGFLDFGVLEKVAHSGENLLSALRDGKIDFSTSITTLLLELSDAVRTILRRIEESASDEGEDFERLRKQLKEAAGSPARKKRTTGNEEPAGRTEKTPEPTREKETVRTPSPTAPSPPPRRKKTGPVAPSASFVRVDVKVLDHLMDLTGEIVLLRNRVFDLFSDLPDPAVTTILNRLNVLTGKLQAGVMQTRMQPVSKVLGPLPRMVRDLAASCGKKAEITLDGQDTELDRSLIEAIRDPLTHLVRNAVDHGMETPEQRRAAGKDETGHIWINALHQGGYVTIEVGDDGRGIDHEAVLHHALEKHLISAEEARGLDREACLHLIFLPGFSTSEEITRISGRGVGLDVVVSNLSRINGTIDIESRKGRGTVFRLRIPLTLAIMPVLLVTCEGRPLAVPQADVHTVIQPEATRSAIERIHGAPVFRSGEKLLALVDLREVLALPPADADSRYSILLLGRGGREFGLIVDEFEDLHEIVVKTLPPPLDTIPVYGGTTILGDGRVALILETSGLAEKAHAIEQSPSDFLQPAPRETEERGETFLVFRSPDDGRMALPMEALVRLEIFRESAVEKLGGGLAMQYRDDILPLVPVFDLLPERRSKIRKPADGRENTHIAVCRWQGREIGLIIGKILDITHEEILLRRPASREGADQCILLQDRLTELLDINSLVEKADLPTRVFREDLG